MMFKLKIWLLMTSLCIVFSGNVFAAEYNGEYTVEVGSVWRLEQEALYDVNDFSMAELANPGLKFVKTGDVVVGAFIREGGQLYRLQFLFHVVPRGQSVSVSKDVLTQNYAQAVLDLVNKERVKRGVNPLVLSEDICQKADIRAKELTVLFSHTRPDGRDCFSIFGSKQGKIYGGENIAAGSSTPEAVVNQWMSSPGHRENILNGKYRYLGVGYAYDGSSEYAHYWVQMFEG